MNPARLVHRSAWCLLLVVPGFGLVADEPDNAQSPATAANVLLLDDQLVHMYAHLSSNHLGIEVSAADPALCTQLGIPGGVVVTKIPEAEGDRQNGLQLHDVMVNINSPRAQAVRDVETFHSVVGANAGKTIEIGVLRQGKMLMVEVEVPSSQELSVGTQLLTGAIKTLQQSTPRFRIGVSLAEADDTLRSQLGLAAGEGLIVTDVIAGSPAEKAGVKQHDVLVELEETRLTSVEQITEQIQTIQSRPVTLRLIRAGELSSVEVTPEQDAGERVSYQNLETDLIYNLNAVTLDPSGTMRLTPTITWGPSRILTPNRVYWAPQGPDSVSAPQAQIDKLRRQLAEMQSALSELEAALPRESEKKPD